MKAIKEKLELEQQRGTSQYRVKRFSLSAHTYYYGNIRCDISYVVQRFDTMVTATHTFHIFQEISQEYIKV